jgi:hypothetical protein
VDAVARDHNRNFFERAKEFFELLGNDMELWVRLFSSNSMASAVNGEGHELFMRRARELHKNLKDHVKFVTIMSNNSIASRLKEEDEDFSNLICEWMPLLAHHTVVFGLAHYFVKPLGANFFKFVASPLVRWKTKHSDELSGLLKEGRVTPDNLEGILRGICMSEGMEAIAKNFFLKHEDKGTWSIPAASLGDLLSALGLQLNELQLVESGAAQLGQSGEVKWEEFLRWWRDDKGTKKVSGRYSSYESYEDAHSTRGGLSPHHTTPHPYHTPHHTHTTPHHTHTTPHHTPHTTHQPPPPAALIPL